MRTKSKLAGDCPSAIVGVLGPEGDYLGTGFFISRRLIMTCEHVVVGTSAISARRLIGGEAMACRLLETDSDRDLAVLELEAGDEEGDPIRPLLGLHPDLLRHFDGRLTSIGVEATSGKALRLDNLELRLVVGSLGVEKDLVREAQITGGAPRGLSGAPVFAMIPGAARPCVGIMVLGGSDSGQSLLRGPDAMVPLWRRAGVEAEIEALRASDVLNAASERRSQGRHDDPRWPRSTEGTRSRALAAAAPIGEADTDFESPTSAANLAEDVPGVPNFPLQPRTSEFPVPTLSTARSSRPTGRSWTTTLGSALLAGAVAGVTFAALRTTRHPTPPPPVWVANELFPGLRELLGFAEDLEQFSRVYLLPPKNHLGHRQQVTDLNKTIQLYNCTSEHLSAGKNFFRDRLAAVEPESLKDLVVRISEARFPAKYTPAPYHAPLIGPVPLGQPSASEALGRQFQQIVTTWSEHATHLDGPIREARQYLAALEDSVLTTAGVPSPRCAP